MNRLTRTAITATAATALTAGLAAAPAAADTYGSATAKAVFGSPTSVSASLSGSGLLGSTVTGLVQPIVDTLTYAINTSVSTAVRGLLNSSGNKADTTTGPEYYPTGPLAKVALPGLLNIDLNGPNGHAWFDQTAGAYKATSAFGSTALRALSLDVADVTSASAAVTCPTSAAPSASVSLSAISLAGGLLNARLRNGTFEYSTDGTNYLPVRDLHLTTVPGHSDLQIVANGDYLQVKETIGADRLMAALGLGGLFSGLPGQIDTNASNLTLSVTVGPGQTNATNGTISAWGMEVGLDVTGTLVVKQLSSLGVLGGTATITIPSGIDSNGDFGNLMDLKLAYAACTVGVYRAPSRIPPGLI